jgi:Flp pilus assembly protein TadG
MRNIFTKTRLRLLGGSFVRDERGISAVEFALVGPMFISVLMATFDLGFGVYTKAVLQGAIEQASRSASLENTQWASIETKVKNQILAVIPSSDPSTDISFNLDQRAYEDYDDLIMPEQFVDTNSNGTRQAGECYVDRNNNRQYDTNVGVADRGTANDVISIKASVTYKRVFPLWALTGQSQDQLIEASTYLRNQPFGAQAARVGVSICT